MRSQVRFAMHPDDEREFEQLRWLRERSDRRIKQMRQSIVEAVLVDGVS